MKKNKIIYGGTRRAIRKFIHVKDAAVASVNILSRQYKNKNVLITGNKNIKIITIIKIIRKIFKSDKKVYFKRKPLKGHYDKTPFTYKPKITKILNIKPTISLSSGIIELANDIKNNKWKYN